MRTLVLYYSNTGHTQQVAAALAEKLGAELGEITCGAYLNWYGPVLMALDIFTRHRPRVEVLTPPGAHYDLVVVGGPVWGGRACPPVLRALADHRADLGRAGLFVTCRGTSRRSPPEPALADMAALLPAPAVATAIFREAELHSGGFVDGVAAFAAALGSPAGP